MTDEARGVRKTREGRVVSAGMNKTIVVQVDRKISHPVYGKRTARRTKFYAHDEANTAKPGDRVRIVETRPLSRTKRWRLVDVIERAEPVG